MSGHAHKGTIYLSYSSGNLLICSKPTKNEVEVKTLAEFNLRGPITGFVMF